MSFFGNLFGTKSAADLETEKAAEVAKLGASYDAKIMKAREAEAKSAPPMVGTAPVPAGGRRRRKTRRTKRSRSGRKSSRL